MSIDSTLADRLGSAAELEVVQELWAKKSVSLSQIETYQPYFQYYAAECRRLNLGIAKEAWQSSSMTAVTHANLLQFIRDLAQNKDAKRSDVRARLQPQFPGTDDVAINRSIDFALRIWLTLNVREECFGLHTPGTPTLQWNDALTLASFVSQLFPLSANTDVYSLQLDHTFTAANINRLSGIDVEWTPCLADHLRFDKRRRLLRIYPFKQILLDHLQVWTASETNPNLQSRTLIPRGVLEETLLSLNLLFPHWDPLTETFMERHKQSFHQQPPFDDPQPVQLTSFIHWRNRLQELHQIFHAPPVGWSQIWADRRNPLQWYTFWIAIFILVLTVIFGVISSVTGILQTRIAYEGLKLARLQSTQVVESMSAIPQV